MKSATLLAAVLATVSLVGCSDESNPSGSSAATGDPTATGSSALSPSGRIEAGLIGTWVENPAKYSTADTLIFSDTKYRTPYLSGVGTMFTAKSGIVSGGPSNTVYGEYLRSDDTLWFDGLLGESANGVDKTKARRYLKKTP